MGSGGDRQVPLADRERVEQVSARMSWTSPEEPSGEGSRSGRTRPPGAGGRFNVTTSCRVTILSPA
jgi:hypothetical protein